MCITIVVEVHISTPPCALAELCDINHETREFLRRLTVPPNMRPPDTPMVALTLEVVTSMLLSPCMTVSFGVLFWCGPASCLVLVQPVASWLQGSVCPVIFKLKPVLKVGDFRLNAATTQVIFA